MKNLTFINKNILAHLVLARKYRKYPRSIKILNLNKLNLLRHFSFKNSFFFAFITKFWINCFHMLLMNANFKFMRNHGCRHLLRYLKNYKLWFKIGIKTNSALYNLLISWNLISWWLQSERNSPPATTMSLFSSEAL